jgi:hypothetical protein
MAKLVDISGERFGRLVVIAKSPVKRSSGAMWDCVCDCGREAQVDSLKLRKGLTVSCGCKRAEGLSNLTHGHSKSSPAYKSWKAMRHRCLNPQSDQWEWYGGRGITICERWGDFAAFLEDMGERPPGKTIDRINPEGNYEPSNCRWATPKQQAETNRGVKQAGNRAHNKISDETLQLMKQLRDAGLTLRQISDRTGIHQSTICTKLRTVEKVKDV